MAVFECGLVYLSYQLPLYNTLFILFYFSVPSRQVKNFSLFMLLFIKFIEPFGIIYKFHYTIQLTFTLFTVLLKKKFSI